LDGHIWTLKALSQWRGERYDGTSSRTGPLWPKKLKTIDLKDMAKERIKMFQIIMGVDALGRLCLLSLAALFSLGQFLPSHWAGFTQL